MTQKSSPIFEIKKWRKHGRIGEMPGSIIIGRDALKPKISLFSYNKTDIKEVQNDDIDFVLDHVKRSPQYIHWIQIQGIGDAELVNKLGAGLSVNALVLEDITDTTQRAKYDEYDNFILAISRLLIYNEHHQIANTQFSLLIKDNFLISFQETYEEHFAGLKSRLRTSKGIIREEGAGYLFYALMDTLFDRYFALLDQLDESLEQCEGDINRKPRRQNMFDTQRIKRLLIMMQRAIGPERDKMNEILRSEHPLITAHDKIYFRDAYDHCIDIIETITSFKELATNLTEIYLSTVNNQMNDVMKILTIISSIFIPLTFIAGVYGMNFAWQDPVSGKLLPHNMPELHNPHGYTYALAAMAVIAVMQLIIFWKNGWFDRMK